MQWPVPRSVVSDLMKNFRQGRIVFAQLVVVVEQPERALNLGVFAFHLMRGGKKRGEKRHMAWGRVKGIGKSIGEIHRARGDTVEIGSAHSRASEKSQVIGA